MDPKKENSTLITSYINIIKLQYPMLGELEIMFKEFRQKIIDKEETSLDPYIEKYTESRIKFFYSEYKKRYRPIKNAISLQESSGFVEGNNNKFTSAPWVNSSNVFYMVKYFSQPFQEI